MKKTGIALCAAALVAFFAVLAWALVFRNGVASESREEFGREDGRTGYYETRVGDDGIPYYDGAFVEKWPDGGLKESGTFMQNKKHGIFDSFYASGTQRARVCYEHGELHGTMLYWHENGRLSGVAQYRKGGRDGPAASFSESGQFEGALAFHNNELVGTQYKVDKNGNVTAIRK